MANTALSKENIWLNKSTYDKAEQLHFERLAKENQHSACPNLPPSATTTTTSTATTTTGGKLANEVAKARQHIKKSLQCMNGIEVLVGASNADLGSRLANLEQEHCDLKNVVKELKDVINKLTIHVREVEDICKSKPEPYIAICPAKPIEPVSNKDEGEDDIDLFASDSEGEDAEASKVREARLAEYNAKKSKKPVLIAKSNIILDVKPWDDETDLIEMEKEVRKISCDGLLWGAAKHVPLAYGIHKLQISCVVEDDKVSVDWLTDTIQNIEVYVQSVDIAAFNKV